MTRLRFTTARQVFEAFPPALDDIEAEPSDIEPVGFLKGLLDGQTPEDAIGFCAYMLPRREAVWWACQCIRAGGAKLEKADTELLEIAEAWVNEPEEERRLAANQAGMAAVKKGPAAWAALAAAWSGGSLTPEPQQPVPPPPYLTAQAVRAAVLTTLASAEPAKRRDQLRANVQAALKLIE